MEAEKLTVFVPEAFGIGLDQQAEYLGVQTFRGGGAYEAYSIGASQDRGLQLSIEGSPPGSAGGKAGAPMGPGSNQGTALGLGALGLAMGAFGVWWLRRTHAVDEGLDAVEEAVRATPLAGDS